MGVRKAIKQFDKFVESKRKIGNVEIKINKKDFWDMLDEMFPEGV